MTAGPYSIGSNVWPGVSKLVEELGELGQVLGKLIATGGHVVHWDGEDTLDARMQDEMGDVLAAIAFMIESNPILSDGSVQRRADEKLALFRRWHVEQAPPAPPTVCDPANYVHIGPWEEVKPFDSVDRCVACGTEIGK